MSLPTSCCIPEDAEKRINGIVANDPAAQEAWYRIKKVIENLYRGMQFQGVPPDEQANLETLPWLVSKLDSDRIREMANTDDFGITIRLGQLCSEFTQGQ